MTTTGNNFFGLLETFDIDGDAIREKLPESVFNKRSLLIIFLVGVIGITCYAVKRKIDKKPKDDIISDSDLPPYLNKDF